MSLVTDLALYKDGATGDMYYRDATGKLVPVSGTQTTGYVPTKQAGGTIAWAAGSGGASFWTDLTFTGGSSTKWGKTVYASDQSITLADGDKIEIVMLMKRAISTDMVLALSPDAAACYFVTIQADNNYVFYRYATSGGSSTVLSGGTVNQSFGGSHELSMIVFVATNRLITLANQSDRKTATDSNVTLTVSTNQVYIGTGTNALADVKSVRYRKN